MARKIRKVVDFHEKLVTTAIDGSTNTHLINLDGYQVTDSTNHPFFKEYIKRGRDVGGTFYSYKPTFEVIADWNGVAGRNGLGTTGYAGTILAENPNNKFESPSNHYFNTTDRNTMIVKGATAVARTIPTNPLVDASVTLGELRMSGIPSTPGHSLLKSKFLDLRKAGGEVLNIEFGWKPLISDIQGFAKAVIQSEQVLEQLARDAGRHVRRRYDFPLTSSVTTSTINGNVYPYPAMVTPNYAGGNSWVKKTTTTTEKKFWFSGAFTYHYPKDDSFFSECKRYALQAKKLYGVRLTPDVAWNLSPWSWAADWAGNMGDNISTLSAYATDGLVMPHGYIMYQLTRKVLVELSGPGLNNGQGKYYAQQYTHVDKMRLRASPFGFGLSDEALTPRQWTIIGALGIANAPGRRSF